MAQELKAYGMDDPEVGDEYEMYKVSEVDAVLAEKDAEIRKLNDELRADIADATVEKLKAENAELKAKLESVQASMDADLIDAGMENRRLKRALFIAHAIKAKFKWWWMSECKHNESCKLFPDQRKIKKFTNSAWVCSKSQERCRVKAEQYK